MGSVGTSRDFKSPPDGFRQRRVLRGLSQPQLAEAAGVSFSYIRLLEGGWLPADPDGSKALRRVLATLDGKDPEA